MVQLATDTRVIDEKYVCNSGECPSRRTAVVIEKKMFYYFLALRLRFERSIGKSVFNILKPVNRLCLSVKKLKTNICLIHFYEMLLSEIRIQNQAVYTNTARFKTK